MLIGRRRRGGGGRAIRDGGIHDQPANLVMVHAGLQFRIVDALSNSAKKTLLTAVAAVVRHPDAVLA